MGKVIVWKEGFIGLLFVKLPGSFLIYLLIINAHSVKKVSNRPSSSKVSILITFNLECPFLLWKVSGLDYTMMKG